MASEKLIVLSDLWGAKRGLWITSYLGYLQQYFDIEYYDIQQLAHIDTPMYSEKALHTAFVNGGIDTAVKHLLKRNIEPAHYLAFSTGGTIAWKANLKGLPMKSLYAVSATRIRMESKMVNCDVDLLFGEKDLYKPNQNWADTIGITPRIMKNFGHEMYSDEKIIQKVSLDLLNKVTKKQSKEKAKEILLKKRIS